MKKVLTCTLFLFALSLFATAQKANTPPRVHYFYNSGWLVETPQHVLVFDFVAHPASGITTATLQTELQRATAGGKPVLHFITHDHPDHYDSSVFGLEKSFRNITYVLGWQPTALPTARDLKVVLPGDSLVGNSYRVYAHAATDEGSGLLVQVDGYNIYHAGDHALWAESLLPDFTRELTYIRSKAATIDLAFLPAARGTFVQCAVDSVMEKGVRLSAMLLQPKAIALQHIGCPDRLSGYGQVRQALAALPTRWIVPQRYNQSF